MHTRKKRVCILLFVRFYRSRCEKNNKKKRGNKNAKNSARVLILAIFFSKLSFFLFFFLFLFCKFRIVLERITKNDLVYKEEDDH